MAYAFSMAAVPLRTNLALWTAGTVKRELPRRPPMGAGAGAAYEKPQHPKTIAEMIEKNMPNEVGRRGTG